MGVLNYTPTNPTVHQVINQAFWEQEITTPLTTLQDVASSFTSTLTATTTNPTVGTGSSQSSTYMQIGKLIFAWIDFTFGSSGFTAGSGQYELTLPVTANTNALAVGGGHFVDASTGTYYLLDARLTGGGTQVFMKTDASSVGLSSTVPVTPANSDSIHLHLCYPAA